MASVRTQVANRRSVKDGLFLHAWTNDIVGDLNTDGLAQFIRLWEVLVDIQLSPNADDKPIWFWNAEGVYTASPAYRVFCEGGIRLQTLAAIWKCWCPLACKLFMWLAAQYRLWTLDRRLRNGLHAQSLPCYLCEQEEDKDDHILLQYVFVRHVWFLCFSHLQLDQALLSTVQVKMEGWWCTVRKQIPKVHRKGFDTIVMLVFLVVVWCLMNGAPSISSFRN